MASREPTLEEKKNKVGRVSGLEQVWWKGATAAWNANDFPLSGEFTAIGGQAEHFAAELSAVPEDVTSEENVELQVRIDALEHLVHVQASRGYSQSGTELLNILAKLR